MLLLSISLSKKNNSYFQLYIDNDDLNIFHFVSILSLRLFTIHSKDLYLTMLHHE